MRAVRGQLAGANATAARASAERTDLENQLRNAEERNGALTELVRGLGGNVRLLSSQRSDLAASVSELEAERASLRDGLGQARQALEEMRAREARAQAQAQLFRTMIDRFRSMIDAGQLRVRVTRNRLVVALPEGVLFDTGSAVLKSTGRAVLSEIGAVLRTMDRDFQVAGHTDNVPIHNARFPSNWELSTTRAVTVSHFLLEGGFDPRHLSAAGYADTQPVAANDTPEGRGSNRRTEIVLVPAYEELPDLSALRDAPAPR